mmetsp:Transcript_27755/g.86158  ORF Transcript_27755/g.86158 Transcript_27755/m.86158 type:complete len:212 (-) Transcript_27755:523-1158(-)
MEPAPPEFWAGSGSLSESPRSTSRWRRSGWRRKNVPWLRIALTRLPSFIDRAASGHGSSSGTTNVCWTLRWPLISLKHDSAEYTISKRLAVDWRAPARLTTTPSAANAASRSSATPGGAPSKYAWSGSANDSMRAPSGNPRHAAGHGSFRGTTKFGGTTASPCAARYASSAATTTSKGSGGFAPPCDALGLLSRHSNPKASSCRRRPSSST